MNSAFTELAESEQKAIMGICILAAFADNSQNEVEREEIRRIATRFAREGFDLTAAYQDALSGTLHPERLAGELPSPNARALAYEMALSVCNVDHSLTGQEQQFLEALRETLRLDQPTATSFQKSVAPLSADAATGEPPVLAGLQDNEVDGIIMNRAILAGALELMPQTLSTMAIIPLQLRMVYQVGKTYGYALELAHAKEFVAAAGLGLGSQMIESYLTRAVSSLTSRFTGKVGSGLIAQATESGLAFATTYALGQAAKAYYSGGRTLSSGQLRDLFSSMLRQGKSLQSQVATRIADQSKQITPSNLLSIVQKG